MLCFDDYTYDALARMDLSGVRPIHRADFERERVSLAVRKGQALKVSALRKGLRRAAQRVNLDTDFEIAGVSPAP